MSRHNPCHVLAAEYSDNLQHEYITAMTSHNNVETGVLFLLGSSLLLGGGLLLGGSLFLWCRLLLGGLLSVNKEKMKMPLVQQ